ncbi:LysR family transcriptional regulator [Breoghania sp. L-A4]|uniref:LysR family transcriptional regulator n=1 Tax=Breoghania sp. L-A4 TaxID=2304600 RepID=UPI000E35D912|nr:LysR family transcriptional regulator [Breoghania sp. L-A4]AXS40701.1 LysR family transcriptional regulator [Breoghania sp. L-A4]
MQRNAFDGLTMFLVVAQHRSFSIAAARLGVSAPAVSQSIRQLEERLGTPLFHRTTRSVKLTEAGQRLVERAAPAAAEIVEALDLVQDQADRPAGRLRVTMPRIAGSYLIEPIMADFHAAYPDIELEISLDDKLVDIVETGFDAGIRLGSMIDADMVAVRLTGTKTPVIVGTPGYFQRYGRPERIEDLARHKCLGIRLMSSGGLYRWEFMRDGKAVEIAVNGPLIVNDVSLILRGALDGIGLAYLYRSLVSEALADGRLISVLDEFCEEEPGLYMYFPNRATIAPKLRVFVDFVKARARALERAKKAASL